MYGTKQLLPGYDRSGSHKIWANVHHPNCPSTNGIMLKITRLSFQSYINNVLLCEACLLKLKFPFTENFLTTSSAPTLSIHTYSIYLINWTICGILIRKKFMCTCIVLLELFRYKVLAPIV